MDKNKIIILVLIVIIIALLIGVVAMMPSMNKQDTNLTFKGKSEITEGGSLKVKLTDANGIAIVNQTVNVTITDKDKTNSYYSVITNENGTGTLKLDKNPGKYNVIINYAGNDKYKASNATKKITIEEKVVETQSTSSSSGSSLPYSLYNLPPSNDPYPETSREQISEYIVMQKYDDGYISYVDLRTGERSSGGYYK